MIVLDRDFGQGSYLNRAIGDSAEIDARGATWHPPAGQYPVRVQGGKRAIWTGGAIVGDLDPLETWGHIYALGNSAAFYFGPAWNEDLVSLNADDFTVRGLRLHNVFDGIRVGKECRGWLIDGCWLDHIRDDAIEDDHRMPGTVQDSLFDGVFSFLSTRNPSVRDESQDVITIRDTLVRLQPFPGPPKSWYRDPSHAGVLKGNKYSPKVAIHDSLIAAEEFMTDAVAGWGMEIAECSGSVFLWLGQGACPIKMPPGMQLSTDRSLWDRERAAWLQAHPDVRRLPSDGLPDVPEKPAEPDEDTRLAEIRAEILPQLQALTARLGTLTAV